LTVYACLDSLISHPFASNPTSAPDIYTLSLHDALPIWTQRTRHGRRLFPRLRSRAANSGRREIDAGKHEHQFLPGHRFRAYRNRSEEHTSELQSRSDLVCRLLLEKKNIINAI